MEAAGHNIYLRQLQNIVNIYIEQLHVSMTVAQRYKLWFDCQNHARQELSGKLFIREIYNCIARSFSITPQTLYRSRGAMRSYSRGEIPPKYCRTSYNKICHETNKIQTSMSSEGVKQNTNEC